MSLDMSQMRHLLEPCGRKISYSRALFIIQVANGLESPMLHTVLSHLRSYVSNDSILPRVDSGGSTHDRISWLLPRFTPFHFDRISIHVEQYLAGGSPCDLGDFAQPCSTQCVQKAAIFMHHSDVLGQSLNVTDAMH